MITKFKIFENKELWNSWFNKIENGELSKDPPDIKNINKLEKLIPSNSKVLCISVGYGNQVEYFIKKGYQVTGTDIADDAINSLKEKFPKHTFIEHDTENKFPFSDNSFDLVFARLSLHYFSKESIKNILQNISEILKPNGVLFVMVKVTNVGIVETGKKSYTPDEWEEMISKCFNIEESNIENKIVYSFEKSPSFIFEIIARNDK